MSLRTVLLTIQSLLHQSPITNEPGHEKDKGNSNDRKYNRIVEYETLNVCIQRMLEYTPTGFDLFKSDMEELFVRNYPDLVERLVMGFSNLNGSTENSPIWNFRCSYEPNSLRDKLLKQYLAIVKKRSDLKKNMPKIENFDVDKGKYADEASMAKFSMTSSQLPAKPATSSGMFYVGGGSSSSSSTNAAASGPGSEFGTFSSMAAAAKANAAKAKSSPTGAKKRQSSGETSGSKKAKK